MIDARFGHVNIIARDWRALADFYITVFGCAFVPPQRDVAGADLEAVTGVPRAALHGVHLRLPGLGPEAPTLEIYSFDAMPHGEPGPVTRPGLRHLAFAVPSVAAARDAVMAAGGGVVGEIVTLGTTDGRFVTLVYATDPEGNVIELQSWSDVPR